MQENKSIQIKCACYGHALEVEKYCYEWKDGKDEGFNFAVWERGTSGKTLCWRERFRWCWNILKTGKPWADDIIATNEQAHSVAEFILQNLPKTKENEETETKTK